MSAAEIIAVIFGILNVGLSVFLFFRKESKEEAKRREDDLNKSLRHCEDDKAKLRDEYHQLERVCDRMQAKQETYEAMSPRFVQVPPLEGGKRGYDRVPRGGGRKGNDDEGQR